MTNPCELIDCLTLFCVELHLVWQALPLAAAAHSEMFADRLDAVLGRLHQPCRITVDIALALTAHLHVHHVTGNHAGHEQHLAIIMGQSVAFGCDVFNHYVLKQGLVFLLAAHCQ